MENKKWARRNIVHNSMDDIWNFYKKNYDNPVDKKTHNLVCNLFNKYVSDAIIKESFEFKMPFRLGKIKIKSVKQTIHFKDGKIDTNKMHIDWATTRKLWKDEYPELSWDKSWSILSEELNKIPDKKLIVHVNTDNNGYFNMWHWDRTLASVKNQTAYSFKPVKGGITSDGFYSGRRGLAAWTKDDERTNEYYE